MVNNHQWKLVGPWYRWNSKFEDPGRERNSRPIIQKYADSNLVEAFIRNPQNSLKFLTEDVSRSGKRKIFLDTHSRFYLIVCELHCDVPGFPKVSREKVCEAGFVVRKRKVEVSEKIRADVEEKLQRMSFERSRLQRIQFKKTKHFQENGNSSVTNVLKNIAQSARQGTELKYQKRFDEIYSSLKDLLGEHGVRQSVQAWKNIGPNIGCWDNDVEELPVEVEEQIYPLYPLIPDQQDEEHASGHKTIWYGLVPVGSSITDVAGNPQFDDRSSYEVRCFVRRHKNPCPKNNERNDCKGEIVWSRPTEAYQLAPHYDLIGTSNRLTTIQSPDLSELAAQVSDPEFKIGQGLGLAVASPANSELPINLDDDSNPLKGTPSALPSICFFAIPLITIVALFLLRLFMPIVVYLFSLWFLLRLKLCILPEISFDLGAELNLELETKFDLSLDLDLDLTIEPGGDSLSDKLDQIHNSFFPKMKEVFDSRFTAAGTNADEIQKIYRDIARIALDQSTDFSDSGIAPELVQEIREAIANGDEEPKETSGIGILPNSLSRLEYYKTKTLQEVFS